MPLRLITGPANAGKTGIVLGEALAAAAAGASPVIAVPNLADVRRLESELSGKAPLGVRVSTLRQMTRELWALHGDGRRVVDPPTREAILKRVLNRAPGPGLGPAARTPGFSRLLTRLAAGSTAEANCSAATDTSDAALWGLIEDYRRELTASGLVEAGWLGTLIAGARVQLEGPLGLMRVDELAAGDLALLVGLAGTNDVTVALTWEHMFAPTRANDAAVEYLSGMATEHLGLPDAPAEDEIQTLAQTLYQGPAGLNAGGSVALGLASGGEAEAALVARFVSEEITNGATPERIVVAFPRASHRIDVLAEALASFGVSAEFDVSRPLLATSLGRAWHALVTLAAGAGSRSEGLTFIASPYSGVSIQAVHELDRDWRKGRVDNPATLMAALARLGEGCEAMVGTVRRVVRLGLAPETMGDWQNLAEGMLANSISSQTGGPVGHAAAEDAAACQALGRTLAQLASSAIGPMEVTEVLAMVSAARVHQQSSESAGYVQVCDFGHVGARRFDVVVLGGLTEDEHSLATEDSTEERLRDDFSRHVEGERGDRARLQFYSLLTRARQRLYLVRQEADSEGRERRASALWEDAMDAYRPPGETEEAEEPALPCARLARSDIEVLAPALTEGRRHARESAELLHFRTLDRGGVLGAAGRSALQSQTVFSATEVETYLACPYRWLYERVVRPEEIDRALDARELGTYAHGLLATYYRRVATLPTGPRRVTAEGLLEALTLFDEVTVSERGRSVTPAGLSEEMQAARAIAWARNVVGQDAGFLPGFVPELVELDFGSDGGFTFGGYAFRGRVDRVDTCETSAFVTDYKSSRDVTRLERLEAEGKVQTVIYACAVQQALNKPVSGSVYRSMRSGRLRGFWRRDLLGGMPAGMCEEEGLDGEGFSALVARTEERVGEAIEGMRAGRVTREPAIKGACSYCPVSLLCEGARP